MSLSGKFLSIYGTLVLIFGGLLGWISIEFRQYSDELSRFHSSMLSMPEVIQQKRSELRTLNLIISSSSESRIWDYLNRTLNSRIELDARLKPLIEKKPLRVRPNRIENRAHQTDQARPTTRKKASQLDLKKKSPDPVSVTASQNTTHQSRPKPRAFWHRCATRHQQDHFDFSKKED